MATKNTNDSELVTRLQMRADNERSCAALGTSTLQGLARAPLCSVFELTRLQRAIEDAAHHACLALDLLDAASAIEALSWVLGKRLRKMLRRRGLLSMRQGGSRCMRPSDHAKNEVRHEKRITARAANGH